MTPELRHPPTVPSYGAAALADLSSSMLASLDPDAPESQNVLDLPSTRRACLLIVDGLGWELLRDHPAVAPFLSELARNSRPITAGFPSTTVTSLGSICTGQPPGQHGILGYQVIIPGENRLLNGLRWDSRVDPKQWQPLPTVYERAVAAGIAAVHVTQGVFRGARRGGPLVDGGQRLPLLRIDSRIPAQPVEQPVLTRDDDLVTEDPVLAGRLPGANRAEAGDRGGREPGGDGP